MEDEEKEKKERGRSRRWGEEVEDNFLARQPTTTILTNRNSDFGTVITTQDPDLA
jgi:hypothetical protein